VDGARATLVCVHGGLDRGASFARLARRMTRLNVVTYDRRGYQGSRSLTPLGLAHHVADLLEVARWAGETGPVMVFGHSYGGVVALGAAVADPSRFCLVDVYEAPLPWILARHGERPHLGDDPRREAELFFRRVVSDAAWERLSEAERESRRLDGRALVDALTALRHGPPFTALVDVAALRVPTHYVHGDQRLATYYRALGARLEHLNSVFTADELVGAGHGAHLSAPDQLASLLQRHEEMTCASR
jgi:pimeloyl-ACP methyl ester carboxylesterase